jgi:hypothetical protein
MWGVICQPDGLNSWWNTQTVLFNFCLPGGGIKFSCIVRWGGGEEKREREEGEEDCEI